jgi:hypothetical protein
LSLGHNYVGTEHLLLGLVRINEGVAMRVLLDFDADAEKIRNELIRMLSGPGPRRESAASPPRERLREDIRETIAAGDYDRAADLRERMIQLRPAAGDGIALHRSRELGRPGPGQWLFLVAIALAAAGFPLGLLVGWLIWG